ncbi:RsiV family protein [Mycobacterium sp. 852013-51886_SCH5428379]|uniref:RsiV family protein n=1 Tax=Mycobacterium sp. 852013-51886_SCH5428379 TaxID=1834111 RepID=UPI000A9EF8D4|nr:RsiV family protein [Mycobacterium sp. 852013-51886_SCH5428379]
MKTVRSAVVAAMIGATALGMAGIARTAPRTDPGGLCASLDAHGGCALSASGPSYGGDAMATAGARQEQQVVNYLTQVLQDFDAAAGLADTHADGSPIHEMEATSSSYSSAGTKTVVVKVYQDLGDERPATWYRAFSYANASGAPIDFGTLFRPGTRPLDVIAPMVADQMGRDVGQPITIDPAIANDPANYQNFAITDDAVVFFFDRDHLHPTYAATRVAIPRTAIADLLSPGL